MAIAFTDERINLKVEDGIAYAELYIEDITLAAAEQMVELRYKVTDGEEYPVLIDISRIKSVTKEARDFLSEGKAVEKISAAALYTNSLISRIVANFFLGFNRPAIPIKIFTSKDEAVKWAKHYKRA
ncbi:MAG: DUF7793 family protein [Bacteroidia bacterium]